MASRVAAGGVRVTREQAHNLLLYPELLTRMVDMLTQSIEHRIEDAKGMPDEYVTFNIIGETMYIIEEEGTA